MGAPPGENPGSATASTVSSDQNVRCYITSARILLTENKDE